MPIANSRRMTSCSLAYSSGGKVEFIIASAKISSAVSDAILRHIDPENSAIERSVGVDITADILNFLRNLVGRSRLRSFEKHVLENVRKAGAKMFILVDAAGRAPRLHTGHRRAAIFLHDKGQAVRQASTFAPCLAEN